MRRAIALTAVACALLLASACVSVPFEAPPGPGAGEGTVTIEPAAAPAAGEARYRIVLTVGPSGMVQGGGFRIQLPVDPVHPFLGFTPPHTGPRHLRGHVACTAVRPGHADTALVATAAPGGGAGCAVESGRLLPGDLVVMEYWGLAPRVARPWALPVESRVSGGRGGRGVAAPPVLEVLPRPARSLVVTAPSTATLGEPLAVRLVVLDEFGNRAEGYEGTIDLALDQRAAAHTFSPEDRGVALVRGLSAVRAGFARIVATERDVGPALALRAVSNPVRAFRESRAGSGSGPGVLWGDPHFHTGDGAGGRPFLPPAARAGDLRGNRTTWGEAYAWARDVAGLDFAAATEYATTFLTDESWRRAREAARMFDDPPRFTAFAAYEWRDLIVLLPADDGPLVRWDLRTGDALEELAGALSVPGGPHPLLVALGAPDPPAAAAAREVYSWASRGRGYDDRPRRFEPVRPSDRPSAALMAGSANHWGRPGTDDLSGLEPGAGGLTAVVSRVNSREGILAALRRGDAWATTGKRIYLRAERSGGRLAVEAACADRIAAAALVSVTGRGSATLDLADHAVESLSTSVDLPAAGQGGYAYVRVVCDDGEMAWSSPFALREDAS